MHVINIISTENLNLVYKWQGQATHCPHSNSLKNHHFANPYSFPGYHCSGPPNPGSHPGPNSTHYLNPSSPQSHPFASVLDPTHLGLDPPEETQTAHLKPGVSWSSLKYPAPHGLDRFSGRRPGSGQAVDPGSELLRLLLMSLTLMMRKLTRSVLRQTMMISLCSFCFHHQQGCFSESHLWSSTFCSSCKSDEAVRDCSCCSSKTWCLRNHSVDISAVLALEIGVSWVEMMLGLAFFEASTKFLFWTKVVGLRRIWWGGFYFFGEEYGVCGWETRLWSLIWDQKSLTFEEFSLMKCE